jgi:hypothetical protein
VSPLSVRTERKAELVADALEHLAGTGGVGVDLGAGEPQQHRNRHKALLCPIVKIALEAAALGVAGLDDSRSRRTQLAFLPLALGDVGEHHHVADHLPGTVPDGSRRDLDVDQRSVLALPVGLQVREHPAAADCGQDLLELGLLRGRDKRDRAPDDLPRRPAEDPLSRRVPPDHPRLEVDLEDADRRRLDHRL